MKEQKQTDKSGTWIMWKFVIGNRIQRTKCGIIQNVIFERQVTISGFIITSKLSTGTFHVRPEEIYVHQNPMSISCGLVSHSGITVQGTYHIASLQTNQSNIAVCFTFEYKIRLPRNCFELIKACNNKNPLIIEL